MIDQADQLRRLARNVHAARLPDAPARPLVLLTSGQRGAGATATAIGLATALAEQGRDTLLIDADPEGGPINTLWRLKPRGTLGDVLAGRRALREAAQPGPAGVRVLPGQRLDPRLDGAEAWPRLLQQARVIGDAAGAVLVDGGCGWSRTLEFLWGEADLVLVALTPEDTSVTSTYALLKRLQDGRPRPAVHGLVNRAASDSQADEVLGRFARSCSRFLGLDVVAAGVVPECVPGSDRWHEASPPGATCFHALLAEHVRESLDTATA